MTETAYGLPAGVLDAIIMQESAGDPSACRYEPGFFDRYINGVNASLLGGVWPLRSSDSTERIGRATSWGLMQIMGQTARELGFEAPFFPLLCSQAGLGVDYGARHLKALLGRYGLEDALSAYNAGVPTTLNRASYVAPILARMKGASS